MDFGWGAINGPAVSSRSTSACETCPVRTSTATQALVSLSPCLCMQVRYYNFDVQSTAPAPVYVLYREGEDKPVEGQLDIIDTLPGLGMQRRSRCALPDTPYRLSR